MLMKRIVASVCLLFIVACTPAQPNTPTQPAEPTPTSGEHTLSYECMGEGSPTVILESGLAISGTEQGPDGNWRPVMEGIKDTTRICTYDRVNLGKSYRSTATHTSQDVVDDLHAMLAAEGIEGPYVLAGHSAGGFHIRLFTEQYPDEVVGMLLIDAIHPDLLAYYAEAFPTPSPDEPESWALYRSQWTNLHLYDDNPELFDFTASADQVRETGPFGDLPLIVLAMDPARYGLPEELTAAIANADDKAQRDLAALSTYTQGDYTIVSGTGHFIYINEPQVVIDSLLELITEARKSG